MQQHPPIGAGKRHDFETDKAQLEQKVQVVIGALSQQQKHIHTTREMLDATVLYLNKKREEIVGQLSRDRERFEVKAFSEPVKSKLVKGREASPYGYVLNDWKLAIRNDPIVSLSKEQPGRLLVEVKNPLIGFSVGALELLKEDTFEQLSELFSSVTLEQLKWIQGHQLTRYLEFLEPQQMKELLDDFLFTIRSAPVQQIYQEYDIIDQVVELALRTLLIAHEPKMKDIALKPELNGLDYSRILSALVKLFGIDGSDSAGNWTFKMHGKEFRMLASSPTTVNLPQ